MASSDRPVAQILEELKETTDLLEVLLQKKEDLKVELDRIQRQRQAFYYTIICTPIASNRCQYTAGVFSTPEIAAQHTPLKPHVDYDDGVTWRYMVGVLKAKDVDNFEELDKPPKIHS